MAGYGYMPPQYGAGAYDPHYARAGDQSYGGTPPQKRPRNDIPPQQAYPAPTYYQPPAPQVYPHPPPPGYAQPPYPTPPQGPSPYAAPPPPGAPPPQYHYPQAWPGYSPPPVAPGYTPQPPHYAGAGYAVPAPPPPPVPPIPMQAQGGQPQYSSPPPPPYQPAGPQWYNHQQLQQQQQQPQHHRVGPNISQDMGNGVSRSLTSVQFRPNQSKTPGSRGRQDTGGSSANSVSATAPQSQAGSTNSSPPRSFSGTFGHKRKASQSIEPTNAKDALDNEDIWLPGDDADSHFWTGSEQIDERFSIGTIHWKPGNYHMTALPPMLEESDSKMEPCWKTPRKLVISKYVRENTDVTGFDDKTDPVLRDLSASAGVSIKTLISGRSANNLATDEMQGKYGFSSRGLATLVMPTDRMASRDGIPDAKDVRMLDEDDDAYSPPPPDVVAAQTAAESVAVAAAEATAPGADVVMADSLPQPTANNSRSRHRRGSSAGKMKLPDEPQQNGHTRRGSRHRRNSSVEAPTFFATDPEQEARLAALGVTGAAQSVFNMPGPARTSASPERSVSRPASRGSTSQPPPQMQMHPHMPPQHSTQPPKQPKKQRKQPPPPPPPLPAFKMPLDPDPTTPAWDSDAGRRPSSRASNHTQVGSDCGEDASRPATPEKKGATGLQTIQESPEDVNSGQKRKRGSVDEEKPQKQRQKPDLSTPYKRRLNTQDAYQRRW